MQGDQYNYNFKTTNGQPGANRNYHSQPRTIDELAQWYRDRNLPPYETTRFFIGINYTGKRAFGIYQEGDTFVVYKNKDDGTRSIRYQGPDEAYAVNELFLKLKSEIAARKSGSSYKSTNSNSKFSLSNPTSPLYWSLSIFAVIIYLPHLLKYKFKLFACLLIIPAIIYYILKKNAFPDPQFATPKTKKRITVSFWVYIYALSFIWIVLSCGTKPHYYNYNNDVYCKYSGEYYRYSSSIDDYYHVTGDQVPSELKWHSRDYNYDSVCSYDDSYSFTDSSCYRNGYYSASDFMSDTSSASSSSYSNSDYDWGSNSDWNSGGTNWSSNW